jgi:hypothetical protein
VTHLKRGEKPGTPTKPRVNKYQFQVVDVECSAMPSRHTGEVLLTAWEAQNGEGFVCHTHKPEPGNINVACKKRDECPGHMRPMKVKK